MPCRSWQHDLEDAAIFSLVAIGLGLIGPIGPAACRMEKGGEVLRRLDIRVWPDPMRRPSRYANR
jgi:hypothetical protein